MKLVIGGSTGFVGTELVRQALLHPAITSVVALSRRETPVPLQDTEAGNALKLTSVVCNDFETYSDDVRNELQGADACIWTIAVTPRKQHTVPFEEVCKISREYAVKAIQTLAQSSTGHSPEQRNDDQPFRFVYISGIAAKRDRAEAEKDQMLVERGMVEYCLVRGDAESQILAFAEKSHGRVEASVARPGLIFGPREDDETRRSMPGFPSIELAKLAAALLDQVINGFEKNMLLHDDLVRLGQNAITRRR
ncbi:hypothetical protein N0V93_009358 [Gnomoniopsis smithogilvyi]|uniref:NAD(P)-binding domain-containing protein n=1 Tax=Gnomoniopsis smithogilvyi TaxID=1191159 RepID=A0A9W8YJT8_9PEZI|nr:hypothetical protein N0V93_009358 [Gnomoniopsis smithogilvyi]